MIFTGLSNNWALLQRVNAIEKYLKDNPIVPYAKSTVAGVGTDTYVFDKSQLTTANGVNLMVGDLIVCPDVTLWQVISIADTGEVTARYLVNFKGEQGVQGERGVQGESGQQGDTGAPGIFCVDTLTFSEIPADIQQIAKGRFTSEVKKGDYFLVLVKVTSENKSYIAICQIDNVDDMFAYYYFDFAIIDVTGPQGPQGPQGAKGEDGTTLIDLNALWLFTDDEKGINSISQSEKGFTIDGFCLLVFNDGLITFTNYDSGRLVLPLKATNGIVADVSEDGKFIELHAELYKHTIRITNSGNELDCIVELYNRSATQFNYSTLASYISGKRVIANGFYQTSVKETIYCITESNGEIRGFTTVSLGGYPFEMANVVITDTVEEI